MVATLMGWPDDRVEDLARRIEVEAEPYRHLVFRWDHMTWGPPLNDEDSDVEEFAENVAADLKMQRGRFGVALPWDDRPAE
jgi:hypothetical protein